MALLFVPACGQSELRLTGQVGQAVIYGRDDRVDVYAEPDERWRERARASFVALIPQGHVSITGAGVELAPRSLHERYALCPGERFAEQPALAECSAVLIDRDLLLTAGHCFDMAEPHPCQRYHYVFDYFVAAPGQVPVLAASAVYGCRRIVAQRTAARTGVGDYSDFAVIQLDRPADRERVPISFDVEPAPPGESVTVIGYPSGLPAKIDRGARVQPSSRLTPDVVTIDSDTFAASSGSAVLNADGKLLGNIVSGAADYTYLTDAGCQITREEELTADPGWEKALAIRYTLGALCEAGWPSAEHCGRAPQCGDDFCSAGEAENCAADCGDQSAALSRPEAPSCNVVRLHSTTDLALWQALPLLVLLRARMRQRLRAKRDRTGLMPFDHLPRPSVPGERSERSVRTPKAIGAASLARPWASRGARARRARTRQDGRDAGSGRTPQRSGRPHR